MVQSGISISLYRPPMLFVYISRTTVDQTKWLMEFSNVHMMMHDWSVKCISQLVARLVADILNFFKHIGYIF